MQSEPQGKTCPTCGASVSARAKTCLICGHDLTEPIALPQLSLEPAPVRREAPWRWILMVVGITVLLFAGAGIWAQSRAAPAPVATATPTLEPTPQVTDTPAPTATVTPTPTPPPPSAPPATAVPPVRYKVRPGDTLLTIAEQFGTSVDAIRAFNGLGQSDMIQVGLELQIPVAGSTPNPTVTAQATATFIPGPTPGTVLHVVQTGDTLLGISLKYGVSINVIQKANDIEDAESIKAGQQLVIPIGPTATATVGAPPTPTGLPTYPAPQLLAPRQNEIFEGDDEPILLQWVSAGILRENEYYLVRLEKVGGGAPPTAIRTRSTGWRVPLDLFPKSGDERRTFQWHVRVVRVTGNHADGTPILSDAGPASITRSFQWLIARPTPTPTPGPN